jgi:hypothetical protein
MPAARPSRKYAIVAASVAVHAVLLTAAALHAPRLQAPIEDAGPPEAVIPVLILPRVPPTNAAPGAKPTPIRLHRRPQPFADKASPVAPLVAPVEAAKPAQERAAPAPGPRALTLPSQEDAFAANARNALRSRLNCDDSNLTRAEREGCLDRFGAAGRSAPVLGLGVDRDKASALEAAARRKEQDYGYKRSAAPTGSGAASTGRNAGAIERPGDPNKGMGASSDDLGRMTGNDSRRELKIPF